MYYRVGDTFSKHLKGRGEEGVLAVGILIDRCIGVCVSVGHLASGFNIFLSRHEHEDVAGGEGQVDGQGLFHSGVHVILARGLEGGGRGMG